MQLVAHVKGGWYELRNIKGEILGSDPVGLAAGDEARFWYRSDLDVFKFWDGSVARTLRATNVQIVAGDLNFTLDQVPVAVADVSLANHKLTNVTDPTTAQDAATKAYVDATVQGIDAKASVRAATTASVTLAGSAPNTVDGVALAANDRILVKDQATGSQNGIYIVQTLGTGANGTWVRASDADANAEINAGMYVWVEEGTTQADTGWLLITNNPITLNTTALVFTQFSGAGNITAGAGLTKTGNTLDVGAGTGITVAADSIALDPAVAVRKYAGTYGNGALTSFTISAATHGLGTAGDFQVHVYDITTGTAAVKIEPDITINRTTGDVTVGGWATAPATNTVRILIQG